MPASHTIYFWLSFTGALGFAVVFGLALPRLFFLVIRNVSWARPARSVRIGVLTWLLSFAAAWCFDAYCQWFGLTNELSVMLFLWMLIVGLGTGLGYRHYHRLNRIVTRSYLEQEQQLLRTVQRVSQGGFFVSEAGPQGQWVIATANRAACEILGYEFRTLFDNALIGRVGRELISPEFQEKTARYLTTPGRVKYLTQLLRLDGRIAWVEVSAQTLPDYHGRAVRVTYFLDVTVHMEKNQALVDELRVSKAIKQLSDHVERIISAGPPVATGVAAAMVGV